MEEIRATKSGEKVKLAMTNAEWLNYAQKNVLYWDFELKMYGDILITQLNDFIFYPASIYFHNLYRETERFMYQSEAQINGTAAHSAIDQHTYSDRKNIY